MDRIRGVFQGRIGPELVVGLVSAVVALVFFAWLADEVLEGNTQQFDNWMRAAIHQRASPALTALMRVATRVGSAPVLVGLGLVIGFAFIRVHQQRAAILLGVTMLGAGTLDRVLKLSFHRQRPIPFFDTPPPNSYSFPSGHALFAFCFYGVIAAMVAARVRSAVVRVMTWAVAVALIAIIGLSRIYLGVHYPSDVAAGYVAALVWVITVAVGDQLRRGRNEKRLPQLKCGNPSR